MLKAKLDSARKNKKGFSLVELIIVMAIMVALVAVMAPQFIKYVQRSRDSVVTDACENILSCVKTEVALGHITYKNDTDDNVKTNTFVVTASSGKVTVEVGGGIGTGTGSAAPDYTGVSGFLWDFCGIDSTKSTKSNVKGTISIDKNGVASLAYAS